MNIHLSGPTWQHARFSGERTFHMALIGYGYWGVNILRNLIEIPEVREISVCDIRPERLDIVGKMLQDVTLETDYKVILSQPEVDAVFIATSTSSHFEIARFALQQGKHVFIEKPFTSNSIQAKELISVAKKNKLTITVDHTYLYNGAIQLIHQYIREGILGHITYIDSTRINLGIYQQDVNVMWDLASHDFSIVRYLISEEPVYIRAVGKFNPLHQQFDNAYIFLQYDSGLLVQVNCSWASPVKMRQMIIGGSKKMIIYDDIEPSDKLKIYDYNAVKVNDESKRNTLIDYRLGDINIPKFNTREPLRAAIEDFISAFRDGHEPLSSSFQALKVIEWLEKAEISMKNNDSLIPL